MGYKFAVVSDTHLCADACRLDYLNDFYEWAKKNGAREIFHAGDLTDGVRIYRGQENHLDEKTVPEQAAKVISSYPKGLDTFFIHGNHDLKHPDSTNTVTPGTLVTKGWEEMDYHSGEIKKEQIEPRKDMHLLGDLKARVKLPYGIIMDLIHGAGFYYSRSYGAQKYFRDQPFKPEGVLPDIAVFGHRHQALQMVQNGVYVFEAGCFKDLDEFQLRRGLFPELGGWLMEVSKRNGLIDMKSEFHSYPVTPLNPSTVIIMGDKDGKKEKKKAGRK